MSEAERYRHVNLGLERYHAGAWFEAHEAWEDAWRPLPEGAARSALKGLIQLAAGLLKAEQGVPAGAERNLAKAARSLGAAAERRSAALGLDLVGVAEAASALASAAARRAPLTPIPLPARVAPTGVLYLHGFASSPASKKAQAVKARLEARGLEVRIPDQNEPDFSTFTLSRALRLARRHLFDRTLVVGSSLGGYVAALLAAEDERVRALALFAPAFAFGERLLATHGEAAIEAWRADGSVEVEHYGQGRRAQIRYALLEDALGYPAFPDLRVPTFIVHGTRDDVVPIAGSRDAVTRWPDRVRLCEVDDEHMLAASGPALFDAVDGALAASQIS